MEYLGLENTPDLLSDFSQVRFSGRMSGDPTGQALYQTVSTEPLEKWKKYFCNPIRLRWARRYLRYLGSDRLATMGYDLNTMLKELQECPQGVSGLIPDVFWLLHCFVRPPSAFR